MYLVEYCKGNFINAEQIEQVMIYDGGVSFRLINGINQKQVHRDYVISFLNQVSASDENLNLLEASYKDFSLKNKEE